MIGKLVKADAPGLSVVHGRIVGEDGDCWVIQKTSGYRERWNKCHCTLLRSSEASAKARKIVDAIKTQRKPPRIYGDGDC